MKYLKQFLIILAVSCVGEILKFFIPLPIPASIYGLVIMLVLLIFKRIRLEQVKETAEFLIEIMPVMFIPAGVGLITSWGQLKPVIVPLCIIMVLTTIIVMAVTGKTADYFMKKKDKKK